MGLKQLLLSGTPLGAAGPSPAALTPASDYFSGAKPVGLRSEAWWERGQGGSAVLSSSSSSTA